MSEPITQVQDHEGRLGRLEGIAEQLDRRLDALERGQAQGFTQLRQEIVEQGRRIDSLTRWLVGGQVASLLALGSLSVSIFLKLN